MDLLNYETIRVGVDGTVWSIRLDRPGANNAISELLITECRDALDKARSSATVVVLQGSPLHFCTGADFAEEVAKNRTPTDQDRQPQLLYRLFLDIATGPYVTVAQVRGKTNAGGAGLVAAADIVLADSDATFSLSELLFGLYPACVLPFLVRRCGFQKANYMTLMTMPFPAIEALRFGLVDAEGDSEMLLRRHLTRLRCLRKTGIARYKRYMKDLAVSLVAAEPLAVAGNHEVFGDPENQALIQRYVTQGILPWEGQA
jgi:polyketide biosynthesis enoyl-CoA hydratase PksH